MGITTSKRKEFVVEGYIIKNNSILLMYHKKLDLWLPPGGHIEKYETPEEALIREVKEETGLDVEIIRQVKPNYDFNIKILLQPTHIQIEDIKGTHYHIDLIYVCRVVGGNIVINKESKSLHFFTIDEIEKLDDVPKEVKYFSRKFLNEETDKNYLRLPVLKEIVKNNKTDFSNIKLLIIQHIKKNTIEFIKLLKKVGFKEIIIIAKPYSVNQEALKEIEKYAKVLTPSFEKLENLEIINDVIKEFLNEESKFICLDLGGYFSRYFQNISNPPNNLLAIIEDTKNGIWFDKNSIKLKFPLLSLANSKLKDYAENHFVAKAIVRNSENILINSKFSQTLSNKKILILGYGRIGETIAKILKNESIVTIYDISPIQLLKAKIDGFKVIQNLNELFDFNIIIGGITGTIILEKEHLLNLKNGVILINGSTKKKEFDVNSIKDFISDTVKNRAYTTYILYNGKNIHLYADGYPVNFFDTESLPEFILDIVFAEMFMLIKLVMEKDINPGFYPIEIFYKNIEEKIAENWLKYWA